MIFTEAAFLCTTGDKSEVAHVEIKKHGRPFAVSALKRQVSKLNFVNDLL